MTFSEAKKAELKEVLIEVIRSDEFKEMVKSQMSDLDMGVHNGTAQRQG